MGNYGTGLTIPFDIPDESYRENKKKGFRLHFRCFLPLQSSSVAITPSPLLYPEDFSLKINNVPIVSKPHPDQKVKPFPVSHDLTVHCVPGRNHIHITGKGSYVPYYISIQWMQVRALETVVDEVESRATDYKTSLNRILKKFDSDSEVQAVSSKVSVLDPLVRSKIKIPSRASTCNHIECFDLMSYLSMNERIRTWKCPCCSKQALYHHLIVDSYFIDILSKLPNGDISEVEITPDGSWIIPQNDTAEQKPKPKLDRRETVDVVALDSSEDDESYEGELPIAPLRTGGYDYPRSPSEDEVYNQNEAGFGTQNDPISLD
eukprot:TRINITY_DN5221_c0_g1_i1.p1 TRINITY_DN5221_c0_g1~~TRINITY_DN5221_c0_g1_i1.p1  ORF type:complete len:319 (+),score=36.91 TRINITY_DN5221_c0_g1_i1:498-1454(+)